MCHHSRATLAGSPGIDPGWEYASIVLTRFGNESWSVTVALAPSSDPVSPPSLESVIGFTGDTDGRFWAAVDDRGVLVWHVDNGDQFSYVTEDAVDPSMNQRGGLPSLALRGIAAHPDGSVWVATNNGITRIHLGDT